MTCCAGLPNLGGMARTPATAPGDEAEDVRLARYRRIAIFVLVLVALGSLAVGPGNHSIPAPQRWFLLVGSILFAVVTYVFGLRPEAPTLRTAPWAAIIAILALAIALFVVGGINWLAVLAIGAGVCGRFGRTILPAAAASAACAVAGAAVATTAHAGYGGTFAAIIIGPLTAFFGYSAGRRADMVSVLRRTRADLARAAVAEERLRIARDLHDLLGHSLSLITLKAELAGRVIGTDPGRAAGEIAELESVARQSLSDVRAAVTGYRQPDLAGELVSARQLLDSAGIVSRISAPDSTALSPAVDAALAWAIREGTTNVVRHSLATRVDISVSTGPAAAVAEILDNGPAAADDAGPLTRPLSRGVTGGRPPGLAAVSRGVTGGRPPGLAAVSRGVTGGPGGVPCPPGAAAASPPGLDRGAGRPGAGVLTQPRLGGSGLAGLAERVRSLGGELAAGNVEPRGFRLRVVVPLDEA
jgi:two-component system, NarL family, sensor histidine kinase DesK